ncbi:MAG: EF-P lysine aminoacylase GenX [Pirellulales bacterium]|nr:EF-P lysine aminoacylase GenX [Pirellulales bacterium]
MHANESDSDFRPTADWPALRKRAELLARVRNFFSTRGFLEVETPLLSADTVIDRHIDPLTTNVSGFDAPRYLQTSPEFCMKRMLAAGNGDDAPNAIYQITRAFRDEEVGPLHNTEFTIVEWYRVGDTMDEGTQLLSELAEALLERGPADRVSYAGAFQQQLGIDPHTASTEQLASVAGDHSLVVPDSLSPNDRDGWLDLLMAESVAPQLGSEHPTIVFDYPASQAALAKVRDGSPPVAERFELFVDGVELANGYHELTDPAELRRRNRKVNALRAADGKQALPEESQLLTAMESGLPASTGVALGFDRLLMIALGARSLADVIAFPIDRA